MGHLGELFIRLRRVVYWVVLGAIVGYVVSSQLVDLISVPALRALPEGQRLVFISPFEKIWVHMRLSFIAGLLVVAPLIFWELSRFAAPALLSNERRRLGWILCVGYLVGLLGIALGYKIVLPAVMKALLSFGSDGQAAFLSLSPYVNMALGVLLACAVFLELPVVMIHLAAWGWVPASIWMKGRKPAIVVNAIVSALLSPPDAMSMLIMMVPIQVLYECGILGARMAEWANHEKRESPVLR
jgi:sec-independent protein translocase protein TatC